MKSIGAMLGTIFGVIVSGLIALLFGHFGHVTGFNVDDIENLIYERLEKEGWKKECRITPRTFWL